MSRIFDTLIPRLDAIYLDAIYVMKENADALKQLLGKIDLNVDV